MRRLVPLWTDCHDMVAPLLTGIPGSEEFITQTCQGGTGAGGGGGGGGGSDCTDQDALVASVAGMGCAALVPITGCDYDTGLGPLSTYCAMSCGACGGAENIEFCRDSVVALVLRLLALASSAVAAPCPHVRASSRSSAVEA